MVRRAKGLALLQGLMLCGTLVAALTVRYRGNGGLYPCMCVRTATGRTRDARLHELAL